MLSEIISQVTFFMQIQGNTMKDTAFFYTDDLLLNFS